ncbi:MAG: phosphodiesterase [Bacillota bacterium]|nr:phosphodiesterase [Bacillota bacterium]
MKIGFLADTHGNLKWTMEALDYLKDCDKILHLGDVLAHGPRNALTEEYNPKVLAEILKARDNIYYVKGNCDADVDQMVMDKDISQSQRLLSWGNLKIFASHGYLESENTRFYKALELGANVLVTGHSHIKVLEKTKDLVVLNPGSTTLPKDGTKSIALYENNSFKLINLETKEIIKELSLD